jgi:pimeloyl-ACP methyl ester carboxylesterase
MIVFVHGVPETAAIWAKVRGLVDRESVALQLPGFGCPRPDGFGATKDDYAAWLLAQLDDLGGPVDLVGHDWGAILTHRMATAHGDRLRSWAADVGNLAHPDYEWHAFAQLWQTPGDGEAFVAGQQAVPVEERAVGLQSMGLSPEDALEMASASDATMGACILELYRSAVPNPHASWGPWQPTSAPGLVLHPSDDPFSDATLAAETAAALGARFEVLEGAGHFWPYQAPAAGAAALERFWASLG